MTIVTLLLAVALPVLAQEGSAQEGSAQGGTAQDVPADSCDGPIADTIADLRATKSKAAYMCLVERDDAGDALVAEIQSTSEDDPSQSSVTRALAVHLMPRLGRLLTADEARALNAADRRLLRDAIYARRGRVSPAEDHAEVFEQFDWYEPDSGYSNARLDRVDRANMKLLDRPPPPPAPPKEESALAAMEESVPPQSKGMCGCAAGAASGGWLALLVAAPLVTRRRR